MLIYAQLEGYDLDNTDTCSYCEEHIANSSLKDLESFTISVLQRKAIIITYVRVTNT